MCLRDRPRSFGASLIGKCTLVAITTSSRRGTKSRIARPRISSDTPREYMSAVSKKLIPASSARLMNGRLASSGSTHERHAGSPYVITPRHRRDTLSPVRPRFTYFIPVVLQRKVQADKDVHWHGLFNRSSGVQEQFRLRLALKRSLRERCPPDLLASCEIFQRRRRDRDLRSPNTQSIRDP